MNFYTCCTRTRFFLRMLFLKMYVYFEKASTEKTYILLTTLFFNIHWITPNASHWGFLCLCFVLEHIAVLSVPCMRAKPSEAARKQIVYFWIFAETRILALRFPQHYSLLITAPAALSCRLGILSLVETMQHGALFRFFLLAKKG